jgi:tRNA-Thr(GGU) m(6)t(6)A37 methyltransferase TsaA
MELMMRPIGRIRSPFTEPQGMPIQPRYAEGARGRIEIDPEYHEGLADLDGFERLWVVYVFHRSEGHALTVTPYLDRRPRGLFATRAPRRPNPVGLSCYRILSIEAGRIEVADVDAIDETPVLDLKPYVPAFDAWPASRAGWADAANAPDAAGRADDRFSR